MQTIEAIERTLEKAGIQVENLNVEYDFDYGITELYDMDIVTFRRQYIGSIEGNYIITKDLQILEIKEV